MLPNMRIILIWRWYIDHEIEDLLAWQKARVLMREIATAVKSENFRKDFHLVDQIIRSARSIMANIAEGYGRFTYKDYKSFLIMARGSLAETQNHLYIALDLKYLSEDEFNKLYELSSEIYRLLNGLITHLNTKIKN